MNRRTLIEKLVILDRAKKTGNVAKTCRDFGINRISYYHIKKSLKNLVLQPPPADHGTLVSELVLVDPGASNCTISKKLLSDYDIQLSHTTVHTVLKKYGLNKSEQRWRHLEDQLKYGAFSQKLSIRQRLFMQKHNPCFGAYHSGISRPFEQLNIDVIKADNGRICVAIDPTVNYAFVLSLPKMDRRKIIKWLDNRVFSKTAEFGLRLKTVATSDLKVFDLNLHGESDYDAFNNLLEKHNLKQTVQHAVRPVLDGSVQYFRQLLLAQMDDSTTKPAERKTAAKHLTQWVEVYNNRHAYPYYPNYGLSPAAMIEYYLSHGKNWCGPKSLSDQFRGYISPVPALVAKNRTASNGQVNSVYSSWAASLFK